MKKRIFEFIKDGKVIDTFVAQSKFDVELLIFLKKQVEKRGISVKEV